MPLTFGDVAAATRGGLIRGNQSDDVDGISIDSRRLVAGDLFVAIRGDRFDGHRFLEDAFARGAKAAVVDKCDTAGNGERASIPPLICVGDTTRALQDMARDVRRRS